MTLCYTFTVSVSEYRRLRYFHTFRMRKAQSWFVGLAWVGAVALAVANVAFDVEMSSVMQMCYIAVGASVPLLVLSCELSVRRYRNADLDKRERSVAISPEWLKFRIAGDADSEKVSWEKLAYVYDLDVGLVVFRDVDKMVLIPWRVVPVEDVGVLCGWCEERLGRAFKLRRKAT